MCVVAIFFNPCDGADSQRRENNEPTTNTNWFSRIKCQLAVREPRERFFLFASACVCVCAENLVRINVLLFLYNVHTAYANTELGNNTHAYVTFH